MNRQTYYPWLIFICMMCMVAGMTGMLMNCTGVFFSAIITDLGFKTSQLSLYYMIRSLVTAFALPILLRKFLGRHSKAVLVGSELVMLVSFGAMSLFHRLAEWYVDAVFCGIGGALTMICVPIVLNNWFVKKRGFLFGTVMAASGVAGALFSPFASTLITTYGWRTAIRIFTVIGLVLIVLPSVLLFRLSPDEIGLRPYGYGEKSEEVKKKEETVEEAGKYTFVLAWLAVIGPLSLLQFANQIPVFAGSLGYDLSIGAFMTSLVMVGNLCGKVLFGSLCDRIGIKKAVVFFLGLIAGAMILFLLHPSKGALYAGAVLFGCTYAIGVNMPSMLMLRLYGESEYKKKLGSLQSLDGYITAVLSVVFPYIYDFTGSFNPVFIYGVTGCVLSACLILHLLKNKG